MVESPQCGMLLSASCPATVLSPPVDVSAQGEERPHVLHPAGLAGAQEQGRGVWSCGDICTSKLTEPLAWKQSLYCVKRNIFECTNVPPFSVVCWTHLPSSNLNDEIRNESHILINWKWKLVMFSSLEKRKRNLYYNFKWTWPWNETRYTKMGDFWVGANDIWFFGLAIAAECCLM